MDPTPLDAPTLAFLSRLPLVLSPRPQLSSAASHHLAAATQGSSHLASRGGIQCRACRAQLVGGINASVWVERGELWSACGGCGAVSRRASEAVGPAAPALAAAATTMGKGALEPVKKRRRVALQRRLEAVHPTALASTSARPAAPARGASPTRAAAGRATRPGRDEPASNCRPPPPTTTMALPPPSTSTAAPATSRPPRPSPASTSLPPGPPVEPSRPASAASTSRSTPSLSTAASPSLTSTPTPTSAPTAASKKRKRPKQPSGLAELLEAKKKREQGEKAAGGLGLAGFLQGL
ncbi:hypothetical protein JCM3775_003287 [Rhodotorula graminis]